MTAPSVPTLADELRLTPQARTILAHLRRHGKITPAKALIVHGISRLASCIHEIRKIGHNVDMKLRVDDVGVKYGEYIFTEKKELVH